MTQRELSVGDRLDILDLYARQSQAIDSGDGAAWAATFTDDGRFVSPTFRLTATGTAELREFAQASDDAAKKRGEQLRHLVSGVALSAHADGASSVAYLIITATSTAGSRIDRTAIIRDQLSLTAGGWRFSERIVERDGLTANA